MEWDSRQLMRGSTSSIFSSSFLLKHGQSSTTAFAKASSASDVMIFNEGIIALRCSMKEEVVPVCLEFCTVMNGDGGHYVPILSHFFYFQNLRLFSLRCWEIFWREKVLPHSEMTWVKSVIFR